MGHASSWEGVWEGEGAGDEDQSAERASSALHVSTSHTEKKRFIKKIFRVLYKDLFFSLVRGLL
eukprot:scaffold288581_cov19-Tisochrysis_lutea.AAC.1